jgi:hypothetical protein
MVKRKASVLAGAVCGILIALGGIYGGMGAAAEAACAGGAETARACGRCGDGQCVKSCGETATSCPADCGGKPVPSVR